MRRLAWFKRKHDTKHNILCSVLIVRNAVAVEIACFPGFSALFTFTKPLFSFAIFLWIIIKFSTDLFFTLLKTFFLCLFPVENPVDYLNESVVFPCYSPVDNFSTGLFFDCSVPN